MDKKPFFSVVIPLYNKEDYIEDTLKSVFAQTFSDFEVIIINDGCTDKTMDIVHHFKDPRLKIFNQLNAGLSIARNNGIKKATTDYIAFIDGDDLWGSNHLQQLYDLIKLYPNKGLYSTGYTIQKSKKTSHRAQFNDLPKNFKGVVPNFFKHSLQHCVAWVGSICIPTKVLEEMDYFDPEIFSEQDTDLYIKMALNNYEFVLDDTSASAVHNKTMSNNLSNYKFKTKIPKLLFSYKASELENHHLKKYMDSNRFSTIVFFKLSSNKELERQLKKDIEVKNLTPLQRLVINSPDFLVKILFYLKDKLKLNPFVLFKQK
ncbi:glycosyltransferase family 2 protein [Mariniflexile gromovii]|uniref:Glycosyltransferase family 2 protein n=1 Tax=Mariniflexile gromovii TaxID=362523 RepID=A0ABS4BSV9_9FLAO|nr:glycosyltransferase family A protein [Mariniflexile gromovii]MBP0903651.1 glycosyltransferase family 2 protein [Mariniflexile gromovii]